MDGIKVVLFDFDGTVIDGSEGIYNSINYALGKMGLPLPDADTLRSFIGPSLFDNFCARIEDNAQRADEFVSLYRERYAPIGYAECRLYDGIDTVFDRLREMGYRVAICSSKPIAFVEKISKNLGIYDKLDGFFCPGFSSHSSEKHELILEGLDFFGVGREEALMVGDRSFDIVAALKAGVRSLGVRYGFADPGELERAGADSIVENVSDILPFITGEL